MSYSIICLLSLFHDSYLSRDDYGNLLLNNKEIQEYIAKKITELYDTCQSSSLEVVIDDMVYVYDQEKSIAPVTYQDFFVHLKIN